MFGIQYVSIWFLVFPMQVQWFISSQVHKHYSTLWTVFGMRLSVVMWRSQAWNLRLLALQWFTLYIAITELCPHKLFKELQAVINLLVSPDLELPHLSPNGGYIIESLQQCTMHSSHGSSVRQSQTYHILQTKVTHNFLTLGQCVIGHQSRVLPLFVMDGYLRISVTQQPLSSW